MATMLDELRDLAKEDKIETHSYRRLSLASQAEIHEAVLGKDGLKERMDKVEKKVSFLTKAELLITGIVGIISIRIKGA